VLEYLRLKNVGPAPEMEMELAPRLNLITGDNGLGKTFLLDIAWWVLTWTWARMPAKPPTRGWRVAGGLARSTSAIAFRYKSSRASYEGESVYKRVEQRWPLKLGGAPVPGIVIYAQVDGGFSTWDPARNYWKDKGKKPEASERPPAFLFSPQDVWDGLPADSPKKVCNGLILDWGSWQRENGDAFSQLTRVLGALSPANEPLKPGALTRVSLNDARDQPTLAMPYGQEVALVLASAGMRRIVALAYLLVWTWQEHLRACAIRGTRPAREIVFLIDEIEAHLHPQWQRRIVTAILDVMTALTDTHAVSVQLVATTHSPLVLASTEPAFDPEKDAWFDLDLYPGDNGARVQLKKREFVRHGDVSNWLTSDAFDLEEPRSVEAENAIGKARALLRRRKRPTVREAEAVGTELRKAGLPDIDPFWVRWGAFVEELGAAK
jgi:hypothetical protein